MMGKPMKVTKESCQDRLNMKTTTPVTLTVFLRKMLIFWETKSLTMVVSEVKREMRSPGTQAAQPSAARMPRADRVGTADAKGLLRWTV